MKQNKKSFTEVFCGIIFLLLVNLLFLFKKFYIAEKLIKRQLLNDPDNPVIYWQLGLSYRKQYKIEEAVKEFKKVQELDPEDPWIYFDIVKLSHKLGNYSEVIKYGEELLKKKFFGMKAFARNQLLFYLHWYIGVAYSYQEEYEKAVTYLNKAFNKNMKDKDKSFIFERLGYCYGELNRFDDAIIHLKKAIELDMDSKDAHFDLAMIFDKLEQYDKSISEFLELVRLEPDSKGANFMLSRAYCITERYEEAEKYMRKLIQMEPKEAKFYFLLGDIFERKQDFKYAIESYEKSLELNPKDEEVKMALESAKSDSWKSGNTIERWRPDFGQQDRPKNLS